MAARLAEMEVRTLSDKLAVLDANAPVGMLTKGPAKVGKNTLDDIFFQCGGLRAGRDTVWINSKGGDRGNLQKTALGGNQNAGRHTS